MQYFILKVRSLYNRLKCAYMLQLYLIVYQCWPCCNVTMLSKLPYCKVNIGLLLITSQQ